MKDVETPVSQRQPQDGRYPRQIKYIIGHEACERFSYYGMLGILELCLGHATLALFEGSLKGLYVGLALAAHYRQPVRGGVKT